MSKLKDTSPVLEVKHLSKYFKAGKKRILKAVDDVSFAVRKGETLGLVGESGCGKTTCGRTGIGLYEKTAGETLFYGEEIATLKGKEKQEFTRRVQMIFQDPYTSLDPRMKVGRLVTEGMRIHKMLKSRQEEQEIAEELLYRVGLHPEYTNRFISEFSGGQRQRIGIARALAVQPEFVLCDEPVSALDVSVQTQIINLLMEQQEKLGLTYLFIAHNLAVVKYISDRIAVMYLGRLIEIGTVEEIYGHPAHPYTKILLSAIPIPDPDLEQKRANMQMREWETTDLYQAGCRFASRCPYATNRCRQELPKWKAIAPDHEAACHLL